MIERKSEDIIIFKMLRSLKENFITLEVLRRTLSCLK